MKKLFAIFAIASFAVAQEPQRATEPTPEQLRQVATVVRAQRDALSQNLLDMQSQLQLVLGELEAVKKQLAEARARLADLEKPKEAQTTAAADSIKPQPKS